MADTRISALTRLPEAGVSPTDLLPIADLSASETKAITAKDLLEGVVINMDAGSIPASKIDFSSGVSSGSINVTQGDVVLGRVTGAGFAQELACTAAGRALLAAADAAGQRTALGLGTLALRSGSWVDGSSFSGTSSGTNTGDQTITLTGPVTGTGVGTFATTITPGAIAEAQLATGAVTTVKLADGSVTAVKLADQSVRLVLNGVPSANGAFIGQSAFNLGTGYSYTYTTTGWQLDAGVQTVDVTETGTPLLITQSGTTSRVVNIDLDAQAAGAVWAGPATGADAKPTFRRLVGTDLPVATATVPGAVFPSVGTAVEASGELKLTPATGAALGGVSVPGPELQVSAGGAVTHAASGVTAGAYAKTTVNASGHVVSGETQLQAADIASVNASTVTTGTLPAAVIGDHSITAIKLADYATAYIQDVLPPVLGNTIGQLWLNPLAQQIRMWDGNVWVPIGVGALSEQNLRFCGLFNASDGKITILTQFGRDAGYTVGDVIPAATDQLTGSYFVADTAGNGTPVAVGVTFDPGDWIVCLGVAQGWARIDTIGGGGGGGATTIDGLIDVNVAGATAGQALQYDGTTWKPVTPPDASTTVKGRIELATQAEVDAGTDAERAVTPATLKGLVGAAIATGTAAAVAPTGPVNGQMWVDTSKAPPVTNVWDGTKWVQVGATPADASTTVKGVIQLATAAEVLAGMDALKAVTPKEAKDHYIAKNIALLAALP